MAHDDDLTLRPGEPAIAAWRRVIAALLRGALRRLRRPSTPTTEDIHAVRIAIKQTRALLRMVRPALRETHFRAEEERLKGAARQLSKLRDADVGRELLRDLARKARGRMEKRAFATVREHYDSASAGSRSHHRERARRATIAALVASRKNLRILSIAGGEWEVIGPGADTIYRSCRKRMHKALRTSDDRAFHRWRTRLKNLLHVLEFLAPIQPKKLGRLTKKLARLHQQIGADHDLIVLAAALGEQMSKDGDTEALRVVVRRVKRERADLRARIRRAAAATLKEEPAPFLRRLERRWAKWRAQEA